MKNPFRLKGCMCPRKWIRMKIHSQYLAFRFGPSNENAKPRPSKTAGAWHDKDPSLL